MLGSMLGRAGGFSPARLRLLVACGAAAGIACAYNAPLTGAFSWPRSFSARSRWRASGPLIVTSVVATVAASRFLGAHPVYHLPPFGIVATWQLLPDVLLGVVAGISAPGFLFLLRGGEALFQPPERGRRRRSSGSAV